MQKSNNQDFSVEYFKCQTTIIGTNFDTMEESNTKKCVGSLALL